MTIRQTIYRINKKYAEQGREMPLQKRCVCERCGRSFWTHTFSKSHHCDECLYEALHGKETQAKRAVTVRASSHSAYYMTKDARGVTCYLHRAIMEEHLGRKLNKDEVVHHLNGDKKDNRLENLMLMSRSEHGRLHRLEALAKKKQKVQKDDEDAWMPRCVAQGCSAVDMVGDPQCYGCEFFSEK